MYYEDLLKRRDEKLQHRVFHLIGEVSFWKKEALARKKQLISFTEQNKKLIIELEEVTKSYERFELLDL